MLALCLRRCRLARLDVSVVGGLVFFGWNVVELAVQAAIVVPVDPLHRRLLHVVDRAQRARQEWAAAADGFGLEQPDRGLGQRVVVGTADTADGCRDPFQYKGFRVLVPVVNRTAPGGSRSPLRR